MAMKRWRGVITGLVVGLLVIASVQTAEAQRGRRSGGRPPAMGMMGGFGGTSEFTLLRRPDVQKELELLPDQIKDLEKLAEEQRKSMREVFSQLRNMPREQRMAKLRGTIERIQAKVSEILLPPQAKRLKQLVLQRRLRGGLTSILRDQKLTQELGITDSEKQRLEAKARTLEEELRKKIAELRKEAQKKLMADLTPQQKAKLDDLIGAPFEFKDEPPSMDRGGRPAFGGRRGGR